MHLNGNVKCKCKWELKLKLNMPAGRDVNVSVGHCNSKMQFAVAQGSPAFCLLISDLTRIANEPE